MPARMGERARILVVDDDPIATKNLRRILTHDGHSVTVSQSGGAAIAELESGHFDLVLTDLVMDEIDGLDVLDRAKAVDPETEVIVITGHASVDTAISAMSRHAFHYLQKPLRTEEVRHLVERALEKRSLSAEVTTLRRIVDSADLGIIGNSPKIIALRQLIRHISRGEANVLITGKSGTGKELVASAIHKLSARAARRFLAVNCASFTEELLANELFGHEAGAFTGANRAKAGLLEAADGGTVFFDEVGDMSLAMQAKLLRAIQERQLLRVGGSTPISIDIRIIAATNKDLKKAMHIGSFREDLYFRLNVVPVQLPTLAERRDDIPLLARHFLDRFNETAPRPIAGFSDPAMKVLTSYDYPGNVRELENLVARSASLARGEMIEVRDLPEDLLELETFTFEEPVTQFKSLAEIELEYIRWVLARCDNNKSRAAEILGINRVSLYRKLRKSQLQED